jgi:transposase
LRDYLLELQAEILPKSPEGRAVRYALKNWTALTRYCEDGDLEIDNNATERAIRGVAVGRNNWMFFGSDQGGKTAAVLRSFVATCQRAAIDPFIWLKDVLSRIAAHPITRLADLLPHYWTPAQA